MTLAKCKNCDETGEVDSGALDPQMVGISITCPVCMGIGKAVVDEVTSVGDCCDCKIYWYESIFYAKDGAEIAYCRIAFAVDMYGNIVMANYDDNELCRNLMDEFCGGAY